MATIFIPTPLRPYTNKASAITVSATTIGEALAALTTEHTGLKKHLFDGKGKVRSFVNIYVGDEDIRFLQQHDTPVNDSTEITIVPSIAGGAR